MPGAIGLVVNAKITNGEGIALLQTDLVKTLLLLYEGHLTMKIRTQRKTKRHQYDKYLETKDLTVTFGGLNACDHVDLEVPTGKFVGLIGPNGAGKTTFIDAITGYVPHQLEMPYLTEQT
ncbi:MAG: hypothetical protein CM15mP49_16710 [Actinomycetota bacterium]|nr:MAG: hypothetical protein CM15mP49_16710 [Actinomycetota bacterium]